MPPTPIDVSELGIMFSSCLSTSACVREYVRGHGCDLLARYPQRREFHQTLADEVAETTHELGFEGG